MAREIADSRQGRGGIPRAAALARPARLIVAGLLALATAICAWFGASIIAIEFTPTQRDSPYVIIGAIPLLIGVAAAIGSRLIIGQEFGRRHSAAYTLIAAAIVALATGLGVATSFYQGAIRQTMRYPGPPIGYTFDYPRDSWTLFPTGHPDVAARSVALMNWRATSPGAPVPVGGLRVRIGPHEGPAAMGAPFAVGEGRYPGTIAQQRPALEGDPHAIIITYAARGQDWRIVGEFAESPDTANPNTGQFFDIVGSLRHDR